MDTLPNIERRLEVLELRSSVHGQKLEEIQQDQTSIKQQIGGKSEITITETQPSFPSSTIAGTSSDSGSVRRRPTRLSKSPVILLYNGKITETQPSVPSSTTAGTSRNSGSVRRTTRTRMSKSPVILECYGTITETQPSVPLSNTAGTSRKSRSVRRSTRISHPPVILQYYGDQRSPLAAEGFPTENGFNEPKQKKRRHSSAQ